ncbi:DUF1254 domain-containing protein [Nocardia sp. 2]|uniref:DUF1254 domain-containing protein n=1 Tax=Nocardia acididurans TaxID=2802282 RepID=A0ABS1MFK6_9NOCA|nr:DUF1254 domain-containing protein [Nocardia acididurans]MBL1079437.1 DUF1254 domain-containing protein [Nocardia acididurans]
MTADNFVRAETDREFAGTVAQGGFGAFHHNREPMPVDHQTVVRPNRDTLYSSGVFDLDAGPVSITLPDAGKRFLSMQVITEDEYNPEIVYRSGTYTYDRDQIGTRYVMFGIRIFADPNDPADIDAVHRLQDQVRVQQAQRGVFQIPQWDQASQDAVRSALLTLAATLPDTRKAFGPKGEVDEVRHLLTAASAWGGNPDKDALYLTVTPPDNTGTVDYTLHVEPVPVDGFWSVSLYNAEGYYVANPQHAYSINNVTAATNPDGSVDIRLGGCDGQAPNCLPTMPGWNYMVRLYRPQPSILDGQWVFPAPQPIR